MSIAFRLILVAAVTSGFFAARAGAEVTGELDLLLKVAEAYSANKDAVRTWRGHAVVRELYRGDERDPHSRKAVVDFLLDRDRNARRWTLVRSGGVFVREGDAARRPMPPREHRGLVTGDTFVEVDPFEVPGGKPRRVSLHDRREARDARDARATFDPMDYLADAEPDVGKLAASLHGAADEVKDAWHVSRDGDVVTLVMRRDAAPELHIRYTVDLARGGSLTSYTAGVAGRSESVHAYEYEQVGGLWILKRSGSRRFKIVDGRRQLVKETIVEFSDNRVNERVEDSEFTWAAAGVPKDGRVTDMRPGTGFRREWVVGDEAENHPNVSLEPGL
jgi:hypothetical protein